MTTQTPPAGWYADPLAADGHRYWDGTAWTDHTSPPPAAPPAPEAPAASDTFPPVTTQPMVAQVPRQQSYAAAQPYAFTGGAAGPATLRSPHLYPSRQGRSIGVNVLIGLAIAGGVLLLVGILAAIAIPVFLNQRAKSAPHASITLPETAAGLVRSDQPDAGGPAEKWLSAPVPGSKSAAYYDTPAGKHRALVLISQLTVSPTDQSDYVAGTANGAGELGVTSFHTVDPGTAGGQLRCGSTANGGGTVCGFAAPDMVGTIDVVAGTGSGDTVAVRLLEAIRRPAS